MKRSVLLLLLFVRVLAANAQEPVLLQDGPRASAIDKILAANDIRTSLRFDFVLTRHSALMTQDLVSSGHAAYVYPDRVRWEVVRPKPALFVLNGTETADRRRQALMRNLSRIGDRGLINDTDFEVTVYASPGRWQVDLIPLRRDLAQLFECITLLADSRTGELHTIVLTEVGGDLSYLQISSLEKGLPLSDGLFDQP